jgi:hypothetical protein
MVASLTPIIISILPPQPNHFKKKLKKHHISVHAKREVDPGELMVESHRSSCMHHIYDIYGLNFYEFF